MIDAFWVLVALLLPWGAGIQVCSLVLPASASRLLCWGAGFFIGYLLVTSVLWLQYNLIGRISFLVPALVLAVLGVSVWVGKKSGKPVPLGTGTRYPSIGVAGLIVLGVVLVLPVVMDVWFRPLFPWDAWYAYGLKAKTFFHYRELVEFVAQNQWLGAADKEVFNTHVGHGLFVPLVQTWMALGLGRWSESLVNMPWPAAWISISLLCAGIARYKGARPELALAICAAVLTIPFVGVHAVLAGYADLWLTGFAVMLTVSFLAMRHGESVVGWALIAVAAILGACWTKSYGLALAGVLMAAWVASLLSPRARWVLLGLGIVASTALLFYMSHGAPFDIVLPLGSMGELGFRDGVLKLIGFYSGPIRVQEPGVLALLEAAFIGRGLGPLTWLCVSLVILLIFQRPRSPNTGFLLFWLLLIVTVSWTAFSYMPVGQFISLGTIHNRFLMFALLITFAICITGLLEPRQSRSNGDAGKSP